MLRVRFVPLFLLIIMLLPLPGLHAADILTPQQLIEKSGIDRAIKELPAAFLASVEQLKQQMTVEDTFVEAWNAAIPVAYNSDKILKTITDGLNNVFSEEEQRQLLTHYDSPLGKRIVQLEVAANNAEAQAKIMDYANKIKENPGNHAERLPLYEALDEASRSTDTFVTIALNTALAMQIGMLSQGTSPAPAIEDVKAELEKQRGLLAGQLRELVTVAFAYTYRDLSTADLQTYIEFANSPAGKKFFLVFSKLFAGALTQAADVLGEELAKGLKRKPV